MKNDALLKLLEDLPDDLIDSAADPQPHRRPVLLRYALPAAAACLVIAVSAFLWPKLRTEKPEVTEESSSVQVTTVLPAETEATDGTSAQQGNTLTETTDPYYVHIVTEPVYHFTTAPRPGKTDPDATEEGGGEEQGDPAGTPDTPNQPQQQNQQPGNNRTTTAPNERGSSQTPSRTTANTERPQQQGQPTQTDPAPGTMPSGVEPPEQAGVESGKNGRIPCSITRMILGSGNGPAPPTGRDDEPITGTVPKGEEPEIAKMEGNTLVIRMDTRCADAMVSYLGLRNGKLTIEILYDNAQYGREQFEFRIELPPDVAAEIYNIEAECFDVDDVDEYIHDRDNVTLVIL